MPETKHRTRYDPQQLAAALGSRNLVLVGLMGAGKTVIGRLVAEALGRSFADSDHEIEAVSTMSIPELFEQYGEAEFRALEARVIERLLKGAPIVLSTGGGAFMNPASRDVIAASGVSIWLNADLETLMTRVGRRTNRPLLRHGDPRATMQRLMDERYPVYARADITVISRNERKEVTASEVLDMLGDFLHGNSERKETSGEPG